MLFVQSIKARLLFTLVVVSPKSLFWYTKKANGQWDLWYLCTVCMRFSHHTVPFSLSCKSRCLHLDDPWGTDPVLNPFYLGKKKKKGINVLDLDLKVVQIHVLIISLLQIDSFVNIWWQPKICCCLWSIMGKFQNSTFSHENFKYPSCLIWWMIEKPSTLLLFKVSCKPALHGSSYPDHDMAFFVKTSALW